MAIRPLFELSVEPPFIHYQDPVADIDDLIEVAGNHQDRVPLVGELGIAGRFDARPDIDPESRFIQNQHARFGR